MESSVRTIEHTAEAAAADGRERRAYRRLDMQWPVEAYASHAGEPTAIRTTTQNVSSGGVYFEAPAGLLHPGAEVQVTLSVPPGVGYSPVAGRVVGVAEVVRVNALHSPAAAHGRVGVGVRFRQPLRTFF